MEQEDTAVDPQYLKGFNNGYLLSQHEPELTDKLTAQENDHSPYFKGFVGGKQEWDKEAREWARSFSKGTPAKDNRDLGMER